MSVGLMLHQTVLHENVDSIFRMALQRPVGVLLRIFKNMLINVWKIMFVDLLICLYDQKKSLGPFQKSETALSGNVLMLIMTAQIFFSKSEKKRFLKNFGGILNSFYFIELSKIQQIIKHWGGRVLIFTLRGQKCQNASKVGDILSLKLKTYTLK